MHAAEPWGMMRGPSLALAERAGALYAPLLFSLAVGLLRRRVAFRFTATLLSLLWVLPALVLLQVVNVHLGWWSFHAGSAVLVHGEPLELLLGWALL